MAKTSMNLDENVASALSYVLVWVTGLIFYVMEKENKTVRFHAMQSIITFLPLTILSAIFSFAGSAMAITYTTGPYGYPVPQYNPASQALIWISWIISAITIILWIILIIKAYQGEKFKLPIVGDIAEKKA